MKKRTVRGKLELMLMNLGMFDSQAREVLDLSIPKMDKIVKGYNMSWDDSEGAYPEAIYTVLFMTVKVEALDWIINNKPQAWFKPMFE